MNFTLNSLKTKYSNFKSTHSWFDTYKYSLFVLTIFMTIAVMGVRRLGGLQALELIAYDWMVNLHNEDEIDPRLLVVEITDSDIEQQQSFPIVDRTIAQALKNIQQHQPKVIGFDLYREVAYPPGTDVLRQELQKDNLVVIQLIGTEDNNVPAPPGVAPKQIGMD